MSLSCRGHWLNYKNVASQKNIIKNKEKNRKNPSIESVEFRKMRVP